MEFPKQRNTSIDCLKFIFSLCIIGVHIHLFEDINIFAYRALTQSLFRIGVPFYFIVSGYYFTGKLEDKNRCRQWLKRLLKIYIIFEILDIFLTALVPPFGYPVSYIILRFFTTGLSRIYWYLISLILTCLICRGLWKNGYTVHLICGGLFLYLIAMTYDSYSFLFENTFLAKAGEAHRFIWAWPQAGFNESVLFLSIGVYLKQKKPQIWNLNLLLCLSLACLIGEGYFCQAHGAADANCYLFLIPASILLFLYAEAHPDMLKMKYAGELSLYIYMVHIYFSYISAALSQNTLIRFFFIAAVSVSISVLILLAGRKLRRNKL